MPQGIRWPGRDYRVDQLEVLLPERQLTSLDELNRPAAEPDTGASGRRGFGAGQATRRYFYGIALSTTDWSYRIDRGTADELGTLWLTPTDESVEKVRTALAEIDPQREAAEKAQAEHEKERAEREKQQTSTAATDAKDESGADDK
jgi:hypothetical protein